MRKSPDTSEVAGRGVFQSSAKRFRRANHSDRDVRRASHPLVVSPVLEHIYWHGELPPLDAEAMDEHMVEATSGRVPGTIAHRDELWDRCYQDLMAQTRIRLEQEMIRFGGNYAHVLNESIDTRHDGASNESWLHGRFTYMLYRESARKSRDSSQI